MSSLVVQEEEVPVGCYDRLLSVLELLLEALSVEVTRVQPIEKLFEQVVDIIRYRITVEFAISAARGDARGRA